MDVVRSILTREPGQPPVIEVVPENAKKRLNPSDRDERRYLGATVRRTTAGYAEPLRPNWERLSDDDFRALLTLTRKGDPPRAGRDPADVEPGFQLAALGKRDAKKWERLVGKSVGNEKFFDQDRERDRMKLEFADLAADLARQPRRVAFAERGSVTLPREWVFDFVQREVLWPSHVALLTYLLAAFENGALPHPSRAAYLDDGAIVVDYRIGHLLPGADGNFENEESLLDHLAVNRFVEISKSAKKWRITPGSRYLRARDMGKRRKKAT